MFWQCLSGESPFKKCTECQNQVPTYRQGMRKGHISLLLLHLASSPTNAKKKKEIVRGYTGLVVTLYGKMVAFLLLS